MAQQLKWKEIRDLAENIVKLYEEKKIVEGDSNKSRSSDPHASTYVEDSREIGYVNLMKDPTAPFKAEKFGEKPEKSTKFYQRFDFGYDDAYEFYVKEKALPVLYSQYLVKQDNSSVYTTQDLAEDLKTDLPNVNNLIECPRHKVRKFWNYGEPYFNPDESGSETDEEGEGKKEVSAEVFMLIENIRSQECAGVVRFAYAGLNSNHNGNSQEGPGEARPMVWYNDSVRADDMLEEVPDDNTVCALSLTGLGWDNNLLPETKLATGYQAPPNGCCAEHIWPIIGTLGGGEAQDVFPSSVLMSGTQIGDYFIGDWCDMRSKYRKLLTAEELAKAGTGKQKKGYFSAGSALFTTEANSKAEAKKLYEEDSTLDKWVKYDSNFGPLHVRIKPIKFKVTVEETEKGKKVKKEKFACVNAVMSIVVEIKPRTFQPAVRKRWYDMLYYTLRNITGYKYKDKAESEEKIIGVTWNSKTYRALVNAFLEKSKDKDKLSCLCDRWKFLKIGNLSEDEGATDWRDGPFVGLTTDYSKGTSLSNKTNTAQMWQVKEFPEEMALDTYFLEPYFEQYICAVNMDGTIDPSGKYSKQGGFKNEDAEEPRICKACGDIILPWEGGDSNQKCSTDAELYNTHRFTYEKLKAIYTFVSKNKQSEDKKVKISGMQGGICYATAIGAGNVQASNMKILTECVKDKDPKTETKTVKFDWAAYYYTDSENDIICPKEDESIYVSSEIKYKSGYNMYVWMAFDPGGEEQKDLELTIEQNTSTGPFHCKMGYSSSGSATIIPVDGAHSSIPGCSGKHSSSTFGKYSLWEYAATHKLAHWPLFISEDTGDGYVTDIDIYMAPIVENGHIYCKYLGTYSISRVSSQETDTLGRKVNSISVPCKVCGYEYGEKFEIDTLYKQKYSKNSETITSSSTSGGLLAITSPSSEDSLSPKIKIPRAAYAMETYGGAVDERQKYIVLACRGHKFALKSNLHATAGLIEVNNEHESLQWYEYWGLYVAGCGDVVKNDTSMSMVYTLNYS